MDPQDSSAAAPDFELASGNLAVMEDGMRNVKELPQPVCLRMVKPSDPDGEYIKCITQTTDVSDRFSENCTNS